MMMRWYDQLQRDLRLAGRRAARQATFTVVLVTCVAIGIGATTAALSVVLPVLLAPLPFQDASELHVVAAYDVNRDDPEETYWMSWFPTETLMRSSTAFTGFAGFYARDVNVPGDGSPERVRAAETLPGSFDLLGVPTALGRDLSDGPQEGRTALISEALWQQRFGGDPGVLGRTLEVEGRPHEIVGVMPAGIRFPDRVDVWTSYVPEDYTRREQLGTGVILLVGRLADGVDAEAGAREAEFLAERVRDVEPVFYRTWGFETVPLREYLTGAFQRPLWALFGASLFLLLLATANVTNLTLVRAHGERSEKALRAALGARCRRLAQQGLVENLLLTGLGALIGVGLAHAGMRHIMSLAPVDDPAFDQVGLSLPVLGATTLLAVLVAAVLAWVPARRCYRALDTLKGSAWAQRDRGERRVQNGFAATQIALSFVLLIGAGLLGRSFLTLRGLELGFETDRLLLVRVAAPASLAGAPEQRSAFADEVVRTLRSLPGVDAAGATSWVPFRDGDVGFNYSVEDFPPEQGGVRDLAIGRIVTPGFLEAAGIALRSGRLFGERDGPDAPPVAVVSRAFERQHWPGGSALGKRIKRGEYATDRPWIEIVGVVEDIRSGSISEPIRPAVFYPMRQSTGGYLSQMAYALRTPGDPARLAPAARATLREAFPAAAVLDVYTGKDVRSAALGPTSFQSVLLAVFAAAGLLLATAGIYGVTAHAVGRRTREFGLRMALGARPGQVRSLVLGAAARLAVSGVGSGLLAALVLTRPLSDLLYGIQTFDAATYGAVAVLLGVTVLAAASAPARRATRVDPTSALGGG